jgi:hypothetical protein
MRLISRDYENMPKKLLTSRTIYGILCRHRKRGCKKKKAHLQPNIIPSILLRTSAREETENHSINRGNSKKNEQATQRTGWMPWRFGPKKDAETGETFRGSCMQALIPENPNGATPPE